MNLEKEIKELQRKAGSYELLAEEHEALKARVREALEGLNQLLGRSTPGTQKKRNDIKPILKGIYEDMKYNDFQLTKERLGKILNEKGIVPTLNVTNYIIITLRQKPGIITTKDGRNVRLFYDKSKDDLINISPGKISVMG